MNYKENILFQISVRYWLKGGRYMRAQSDMLLKSKGPVEIDSNDIGTLPASESCFYSTLELHLTV